MHQKNLKHRVSKIKSYLEADDIKEIREMDMQGKLKPLYNSVNVNSALKIAAGARRLKLGPDGNPYQKKRVKSAALSRPRQPTPTLRERSNSVTGVFIDAPVHTPDHRERRGSVDEGIGIRIIRDDESVISGTSSPPRSPRIKSVRPITSHGFKLEGERSSPRRPKTAVSQLSTTRSIGEGSTYSSHQAMMAPMDTDLPDSPSMKYASARRKSSFSLGSFDKDMAREKVEEARQDLMEEEQIKVEELAERQKTFLQKVNKWVEENPALITTGNNNAVNEAGNTKGKPKIKTSSGLDGSGRRFSLRIDPNPFLNKKDQWKDLNKCRYLRLADDKMDLSGVNTLAKDQIRIGLGFDSVKNNRIIEEEEVA